MKENLQMSNVKPICIILTERPANNMTYFFAVSSLSRLESCVRDLLAMTNDLTGNAKNNFTNPLEAVDILSQGHLLDKSSCYDPEPEAIAKMLRHVVSSSTIYSMCFFRTTEATHCIRPNKVRKYILVLYSCELWMNNLVVRSHYFKVY